MADTQTPSRLQANISIDIGNPRTLRVLAWIIFIGAILLRLNGLGDYPRRHASDDEFGNIWAGLSIIHTGRPISWTGIRPSENVSYHNITFDGNGYKLADPYMDHPPLFGFIAGSFAAITGAQRLDVVSDEGTQVSIWDVNLARARLLMILIFAATFWLLFSLALQAFSPGVALLSALFYGFMSHAVTHGRMIMADNLTALLMVAAAWCLVQWTSGKISEKRMGVCLTVLTALAVLTKIPAWGMAPALLVCLALSPRPAAARFPVYGFALGLVLYIGWIFYCGVDAFIGTMQSQSGRFRGFNAFQLMSGVPRLMDVMDLNGVVLAGWFCVVAQALRPNASPVTTIAPVFMLTFTFFAGDFLFGWYSAPLYPWFALALALTTAQVFAQPRSALMVAWLLLMLPHAFQTLYIARYDLETVLRYAYAAVVAVLALGFLLPNATAQKVLRIGLIAILAVVLMRECYEVIHQRTDRLTDQEKYLR